jgi:hypothetical protein
MKKGSRHAKIIQGKIKETLIRKYSKTELL